MEKRENEYEMNESKPKDVESKSTPPINGGAEASAPKRTKFQIVMVMTALCLSLFLAALDFTIVATAIPAITKHFNSATGYTWIGTSYFLSFAASGPTWAKISDIFGRKPIMLIAVTVFFFSSPVTALAVSMKMLIAGRVIQGIGAGGVNILVVICIGDMFSMRHRGFYYGFIGLVHAFAGALGPLVGGVFSAFVSWRWIFYVNLPLCAIAFAVLVFFLDLKTPKTPLLVGLKAIDWLGSIAICSATVMFLVGLEFGVTHPWDSAKVLCLVIFGLLVFGIFFVIEGKFAKYPLIPPRIFNDRSNVATTLVCYFQGFTYISASYYLPLYFQSVRSCSPFVSGIYVIPYAISLSLASAACGWIMRRTGRFLELIWFGMFFMTLGFGLFQLLDTTISIGAIMGIEIVAGMGVGTVFQSSLLALQTRVQKKDHAAATSMFGFTRNLATAMSVAIGGVLFGNRMGDQNEELRRLLGDELAGKLAGGSAEANVLLVQTLKGTTKEIVEKTFAGSLKSMWILYVGTGAAGLIATAFIKRKTLDKEHVEIVTGLAEE